MVITEGEFRKCLIFDANMDIDLEACYIELEDECTSECFNQCSPLLGSEFYQSGMDQFNDISDILGMDSTISPENLAELPDELLSFDESCSPLDLSDTRGLPMDDVTFDDEQVDGQKLDFTGLVDSTVDEYWKEQSDSSDSGIYGESGVHIKQEPPSPVSSNCSDAGSDGYGSGSLSASSSSSAFAFTPLPTPSTTAEDIKPTIIINTAPALGGLQQGSLNINSILNSKIKIQPKPSEKGTTATQAKRQPPKVPVPNKPLVLSGEEFARLTASGALRFQPPEAKVTSPCTTPAAPPVAPSITIPASPPMVGTGIETEGKAMKRQQRMIKNRESASLSRKRKKEYLSGLEDRLKDFTTENQKLKQENECLKRKLVILQSENEKLKKTYHVSPAKKACLLSVFLLFTFNIGTISNLFSSYSVPIHNSQPGVNVHHGRQLLAVQEDAELPYKEDLHPRWKHTDESMMQKLRQISEEMAWTQSTGKMNQSQFESLMCPTFFNKTESIRLAEQLAGWMIKHEAEKKSQANKREKKKKEIKPVKTLKKALRGEFSALDRADRRSTERGYQVQVFDGKEGSNDFLDAIHRRNDTFYVLSFNTDYLLVPASAHNKTMRPRMSLVMPIVGMNETMQPPPGSIGMMQIDCEVLGTQLIHVSKSAVPSTNNGTNHGGNSEEKWRDQA